MWPWSNKKLSLTDSTPNKTASDNKSEPTNQDRVINELSPEKIGDAIVALRGNGAHFQISYAQMNGYDEKLTNPSRLGEIIELTCNNPDFSEVRINFAAKCQVEELTSIAQRPEGIKYANIPSDYIRSLQQKEESLRWARETLAHVLAAGNGKLEDGFLALGFDFSNFLVETVIERRETDLNLVLKGVTEREAVLRPLFLRAYLRGRNKYGEIEIDELIDEILDFLKKFFPEGSLNFFTLSAPILWVLPIAKEWIAESQNDDSLPKDGIDFEHWCAGKLEGQGWSVTVSKASGDQGVDVVASKQSICVAVQCKRYNTPIGNKAVQEAFSGAKHYGADLAVVVGTGGFTKSAHDLAASTNVLLLDAEMIDDFSRQVMSRI